MSAATIDLLVLGVSHRTAPVAVRERLAIVPDGMDAALGELTALPTVREATLLSTCNRVEIYAAVTDADAAVRALSERLAHRAGVPLLELEAHLYEWREVEAVHHLFRVASSLDSLVIGEPQILGQVKDAHEAALRRGTVGATLHACFQDAFRVARRVRRETEIARNPVSVSSVAIELAREVFGDFKGRHVLVVGAGKMSELAARTLRGHGATLTVTNRTRSRADRLAEQFGASARDWNDLPAALGEADIVIASTGAQRPVLTAAMMKQVQRARKGRPLFLLDIAVPRDVEPEVGTLDGLYLFDIDDLQKVSAKHREGRKSEAADAEAMVKQELDRFLKGWRGRQLAPTVTALRAHVLGLAQAEAARITAANSGLGERERRALADLADGIAKKLLHLPMTALRQDGGDPVSLVNAVQRLFALEIAPPAPVEADDESPAAPAPAPDKKAAERVDEAGLRPAESVAGEDGNPSRVPVFKR
jgi:glutamyl-tRNA reductase